MAHLGVELLHGLQQRLQLLLQQLLHLVGGRHELRLELLRALRLLGRRRGRAGAGQRRRGGGAGRRRGEPRLQRLRGGGSALVAHEWSAAVLSHSKTQQQQPAAP